MKIISFILLFFLISNIFPQIKSYHTRTNTFGNTRMTLNDFKNIVSDIKYYDIEILSDTSKLKERKTIMCTILNDNKTLSFNSFEDIENFKTINEDFKYIYFQYIKNNCPISNVNIRFYTNERKVVVSGFDEKKVEALSGDIKKRMNECLSFPSWFTTFFKNLSIFFIGFFLIMLPFFKSEYIISELSIFGIFIVVICYLSGISLFFLAIFNLTENIFPDFLLLTDEQSWLEKNSGLIGFIGIIVTIIISIVIWMFPKSNKSKDNNRGKYYYNEKETSL